MEERMFNTREELSALSDLTLIEDRNRYLRLRSLLEGEDSPGGKKNREQIERALWEIHAEMRARGFISVGPNRA